MDLRKIGITLIFVGIVFSVIFIDNRQIFVPALTVTLVGFFAVILGYVSAVKRRKEINDRLDRDIGTILQPLITKYSNLNKEYRSTYSEEEYAKNRIQLNRSLEQELTEKLPYLESREIKKIVIDFSKEQDKML